MMDVLVIVCLFVWLLPPSPLRGVGGQQPHKQTNNHKQPHKQTITITSIIVKIK